MKKYMIIEHFIPSKQKKLYRRFEEKGRMLPKGVNYLDSWIDEKIEICFQLMESESEELLNQWIANWEDLASFEIIPVINSSEAKDKVFGTN